MNKTEIMAALTAAGVSFDPNMTVPQLTELAVANNVSLVKAKAKPQLVRVKALVNLSENGTPYKPDDEFEVTAERAESLGPVHVTIIG